MYQGSLNYLYYIFILGGIKQYNCMVSSCDLPIMMPCVVWQCNDPGLF